MAKTPKRAKRANSFNPRQDRNVILGFNDNQNIIQMPRRSRAKDISVIPRGKNQEKYINAIFDDQYSIVFGVGPAGTGKTMLGTQAAIKGLADGKYEKIVITRPNVAMDDRDIGYLPGTMMDKMAPWMVPIMDVFAEFYSQKEIMAMMEEKIIEIVPLAHMRGRTLKHSIIIVDESQGTTENSLKSVLTRIGEGSKMIITGDIRQSDIGAFNGLADILRRFDEKGLPSGIALVTFNKRDIERHPVIGQILSLYGDED